MLLWAGLARAELEFVPLQHIPPQDIIPMIEPFLSPGETVIAGHNELIVRASPQSMQTIKQLVAQYDRVTQRLMIYVRANETSMNQERGLDGQVHGTLGTGEVETNIHGQARVYSNRLNNTQNTSQYVQVLEGRPAYISFGTSEPYSNISIFASPHHTFVSHDTQYYDATTGFEVIPRLLSDGVQLEVSRWSSQPDPVQGGVHRVSGTSTTLRAPLNAWVAIGGQLQDEHEDSSGLLSRRISSSASNRQIEIKVVPLDRSR